MDAQLLLLVIPLLIMLAVLAFSIAVGESGWTDTEFQDIFGRLTYRERRAANERAENLLAELLGAEAYSTLVRQGYLEIPSPSMPERIYRVPRAPQMVQVYENGQRVDKLCVEPLEAIPAADRVLMHKLMIEGNEDEYLKVANHIGRRIRYY